MSLRRGVSVGGRCVSADSFKRPSRLSASKYQGYLAAINRVRARARAIHAESMDIFQDKSRTLLESTLAAGGAGLGGEQGRRIEMRMAALMSENQGIVVNEVIEVFLEELLRQGIAPIPVMAGVLCVKKGSVRGSCSKSTGDTLPDVGKCTAECPYQVQEMHRHALIQWELEKVAREGFGSLSRLQKVYWLDHIREQLHAWPDLKPKLDEIISHHTEIGRMI
ncbi:hypothetical protein D3C87_1262440 [compost metagenome]